MVAKDDWLSAAMADDRVVVELLVRLKQSQASSSMKSPLTAVIPPRWGLKQRRSRIVSPFRYDVISQKNKESSSTRCSPTTPLSWSGDTSPSATADGFEESSHPSGFSHSSRSKGYGTNEFSSSTTAMAKRLKRRKALADLRVEESLLLKERVHLKKELASLHATIKEQTTNNEKLKKMKGYGTNEFSSSTTAMAKRLKRRKALADLRVVESLLLKERVHLKKELASLHATFKEQTTNNEKLKKMKLNLHFNPSSDNTCDVSKQAISNQPCQSTDPNPDNVPPMLPVQTIPGNSTQSDLQKAREINSMEEGGFFLPDLNMIPAEDCL